MCLPRIKVNIDLDEDRADEYFSSSTSYSRKHTSSSTTSQLRHRQHHRRHHSSYDYEDTPPINFREKRLLPHRDRPKLEHRHAQREMREAPRLTRDWEPPRRRQEVPARVVHYPEAESDRGLGRYVKRVEQRMFAENLVEVIEIAPRGAEGRDRQRERRHIRHPEWRPVREREFAIIREPKGWRKGGLA